MAEIAQATAERHNLTVEQLRSNPGPGSRDALTPIRALAMQEMRAIGKSGTQIGKFFGRTDSVVSRLIRRYSA